jgi:LAO/AO transport system kinase
LSEHTQALAEVILKRNRLALARSMTLVENEKDHYKELLDAIHKNIGKAYRIGITGPPGVGKSTITNQIAKVLRKERSSVGIVAVDPTSPFTGGAILGDRIRMNELTLDKGVYIRSMATRGSSGGLARKAIEVADIMDAAGYNYIIYETVGVGQVELDIAKAADTTIVMMVPEGGDTIQGMKSGLMEIGEIFVVNKADRPGAHQMQKDLAYVLHLKEARGSWNPEVILSVANKGAGVTELWDRVQLHKQFLVDNNLLTKKRDNRLKLRVKALVQENIAKHFWNEHRIKILNNYLEKEKSKLSPYRLVDRLLAQMIENINEAT